MPAGRGSSATVASPKSTTRARSVPIKMLSGFTSRWTRPARCAAPSPRATSRITRATSRHARGVPIHARRGTPSASSITTYTQPASSSASWMATTFGCPSLPSARASRRNRAFASASAACSTFTATLRSSRGIVGRVHGTHRAATDPIEDHEPPEPRRVVAAEQAGLDLGLQQLVGEVAHVATIGASLASVGGPDDPARIAGGEDACRDVAGHDAAGADHGARADASRPAG